jgi:D-alanine--poly(phosphoribitol) ligase subunit 2
MDELEKKVLAVLEEACGDPRVSRDLDLDLYREELLDSFAWVQLLEGLEDAFGIQLWPTQVSREETSTPRKVVELVRRFLSDP